MSDDAGWSGTGSMSRPLFLEPVPPEPFDDGDTGFELAPDPVAVAQARSWSGRSPFRLDWERARLLLR